MLRDKLVYILILLCLLTPCTVMAQDDFADMDVLDILGEDTAAAWWDKDWKYRRKITLEGAGLMNPSGGQGGVVFFDQPEPLLLYNTRPCAPGFADLRVTDRDGKLLPAGVVRFGRDDGSCFFWVRPKRSQRGESLTIYLYYGNAAAKASNDKLPAGVKLPERVTVLCDVAAEETAPGFTPRALPKVNPFFDEIIVVEAEHFEGLGEIHRYGGVPIHMYRRDDASGGGVLYVKEQPHPVGNATVQIPKAGKWFVHCRYQAVHPHRDYKPFELSVGDSTFTVGDDFPEDVTYHWQTFEAELPAGKVDLSMRFPDACGPDAVLLTQNEKYIPDYRDITGGAWLRVKLKKQAKPREPFYVDVYCVHTTYSVKGMIGESASYLFADGERRAPRDFEAALENKDNRLQWGEWSPWGITLDRGTKTWFTELRIKGLSHHPQKPWETMRNYDIEYAFATRPVPERTFHAGEAADVRADTFKILMAETPDLRRMRERMQSFAQWGKTRVDLTASLGLEPNLGPKRIVTSTMVTAYTKEDLQNICDVANRLGLNTLTMYNQSGHPLTEKMLDHYGITGAWTFIRTAGLYMEYDWPDEAKPGMTAQQTIESHLNARANESFERAVANWQKRDPVLFSRAAYNDYDDEIGPAVSVGMINGEPIFHGAFVEYLKRQNLQPSFFGVEDWGELKAVTYQQPRYREDTLRRMEVERIEQETEQMLQEVGEVPLEEQLGAEDNTATAINEAIDQEDQTEAEKAAAKLRAQRMHFEKRAYYWTQRFRSWYTTQYYRVHVKVLQEKLPRPLPGCVNLQAMPVLAGQMWLGSLNIWDLGRYETWPILQVEDWTDHAVNVAFSNEMLIAAGRKHNIPPAQLVVGAAPGNRIITNMMAGVRHMLFYLYGPVYRIGPVWAEDETTMRDIGEALHQVGKVEDDLYEAKARPADTAILIANASETGSAYFKYPFGRERIGMYYALTNAQIPVELVGESEVREDDALSRYKVLYVVDPHVHRDVQQKISDWVKEGGVLYANIAAMSRDEYDQPTHIIDEALGIKNRNVKEGPWPTGMNTGKFDGVGPMITMDGSGHVEKQTLNSVWYDGSFESDTAEVLGQFENGKPAMVKNAFGKGTTYHAGFMAGWVYSGWRGVSQYSHHITDESTPTKRSFITAAARHANVRQDVTMTADRCLANVHDGPTQTIVFLVNYDRENPIEPAPVTVHNVRKVKRVECATGEPVQWEQTGSDVTFTATIPKDAGKIYVLRFE